MYTIGHYEALKTQWMELVTRYQHIQQQIEQQSGWKHIIQNAEHEHAIMFEQKVDEFARVQSTLMQELHDLDQAVGVQDLLIQESTDELKKQELESGFKNINLSFLREINEEDEERKRQIEDLKAQFQAEYIAKIQAEHKKEVEECRRIKNNIDAILKAARELNRTIDITDVRESHNPRIAQDISEIKRRYTLLQGQHRNLPNINTTLRFKHVSKNVIELLKQKHNEVGRILGQLSVRVHITPELNQQCDICNNPMNNNNKALFKCGDSCCRQCAIAMVRTAVNASNVPCNCPKGNHKVDPNDVQLLVQGPDYDEYNRLYTMSMNPVSIACPVPQCGGLGGFVGTLEDLKDLPEDDKRVLCYQCGSFFCPFCKIPYHFGQTCKNYQDWAEKNKNADHLTQAAIQNELASGAMKKCPTCAMLSTKPTGCNYVVCPGCKVPWCFAVGKVRSQCGGGHGCH